MIGVLINTVAVALGALLGLLFRRALPKRISGGVMAALGLCTAYIGLRGALNGANEVALIIAMVLGTVIGALLRIQDRVEWLGARIERKWASDKPGSISKGFVAASLLFCIGAMAVVGPLQSALLNDHTVLITKSLLDMVSALMMATTLGVGVLLSAIPVFLLEGAIALGATFLQPVLTDGAVAALVCAGSVIIFAIGLNMTGLSKFKVADFLPAVVLAPILWWFFSLSLFNGIFS